MWMECLCSHVMRQEFEWLRLKLIKAWQEWEVLVEKSLRINWLLDNTIVH